MDRQSLQSFVEHAWDESIVPTLMEYIRIPNKSPAFDASWQEHGHMDRAIALIEAWCRAQKVPGLSIEIVRLPGKTPVLFMEIAGHDSDDTVLLYGHYDKQPEMVGWWDGFGPWTPVLKGQKLYGRGGADDGYASFASVTAVRSLVEQGARRARCVILIEGCEESGSFDLPYYMDHLSDRLGTPSLVVCLDSGCGNYDQLWCTTSLRGNIVGTLSVEILTEGVHSGAASGVVPSSFRILRQLLGRIEEAETGHILLPELHRDIPEDRIHQASDAAAILGNTIYGEFPFVEGALPMGADPAELLLNKTWRPTLSVTGMDHIPSIADGGNVLRPRTSAKLSFRTPPHVDAEAAAAALKRALEADPPYGAKVHFDGEAGPGWAAPPFAPWLARAIQDASRNAFGKDVAFIGEGGTIPFMGMLGRQFPEAQFLITGVLGPRSNAHGPNEFLDIEMGKKLTCCVSQVLAAHATR